MSCIACRGCPHAAQPTPTNPSAQLPTPFTHPPVTTGLADAAVARPLCALLRQLASSDANKDVLVGGGGLELVAALLGAHGGSPGVLEQALGLLTNVTLRNPEAAEQVRADRGLSVRSRGEIGWMDGGATALQPAWPVAVCGPACYSRLAEGEMLASCVLSCSHHSPYLYPCTPCCLPTGL